MDEMLAESLALVPVPSPQRMLWLMGYWAEKARFEEEPAKWKILAETVAAMEHAYASCTTEATVS